MTFRSRYPSLLLALLLLAGCGSWGRVGDTPKPDPTSSLTQALDVGAAYRRIGRLSVGAPLPFVAEVAFFGGSGDSTLTVIAISLENRYFGFKREGDQFVARYHVDLAARPDSGATPVSIARDQVIRVATFPETQRADESVLFQEGMTLPPGQWQISIAVKDPENGHANQAAQSFTVPAFGAGSLAPPQLAYQVRARGTRVEPLAIILNPRGTIAYGTDSVNVYIEGYGMPGPRVVPIRLIDARDSVVLLDSLHFTGRTEVESQVLRFAPDSAPLGDLRIVVGQGADTVSSSALVSFSQDWVVTNFDEMVGLLRWYPQSPALDSLRKARAADRARLWRSFWRSTDPNRGTPQHEGLDAYFRRVTAANLRFRDEGIQGWRTDRGEVLIRLGEPDEIFDQSAQSQGRIIRWTYTQYQLSLYFQDETGFGRFRLNTGSRSEFERVVARLERQAN